MFRVNEINDYILETLNQDFKNNNFIPYKGKESGGFKKVNEEISNSLGYGLSLTGGSYEINGFLAFIAYPQLEKIIYPILNKNKLLVNELDEVVKSFGIKNSFKNVLPNNFKLNNKQDLDYVTKQFKLFLDEDALPYFSHWNSLPVLCQYIQQDSSREFLSNLLGAMYQFKKATILKLCNDPSYYEFMDSFYKKRKMIFEEYPQEKVAEQYYRASKELKEVLDKINPIYDKSIS